MLSEIYIFQEPENFSPCFFLPFSMTQIKPRIKER